MAKDTRTDDQLHGSLTASARLATQIGNDAMASPQAKILRDALHDQMNVELTEVENRNNG